MIDKFYLGVQYVINIIIEDYRGSFCKRSAESVEKKKKNADVVTDSTSLTYGRGLTVILNI
jgi:hypothetical protein